MHFVEVLNSINEEKCVQEFLRWCDDSPKINDTRIAIEQAIEKLKSISPNYSEEFTLHIGKSEDEEVAYDYAYLLGHDKTESYSFVVAPWADILGYMVEEDELVKYEKEYFVALVLWEMTWFGFDEESIRKRVE